MTGDNTSSTVLKMTVYWYGMVFWVVLIIRVSFIDLVLDVGFCYKLHVTARNNCLNEFILWGIEMYFLIIGFVSHKLGSTLFKI